MSERWLTLLTLKGLEFSFKMPPYLMMKRYGFKLSPKPISPYNRFDFPMHFYTKKYAFGFLSYTIPRKFSIIYRLLKQIAKIDDVSVFVILDAFDEDQIRTNEDGIYFVTLKSSSVYSMGYSGAGNIHSWKERTTQSWDKALFLFSQLLTDYHFIWLIEHDVLIPSVEAFLSVHNKYSVPDEQNRKYDRHAILHPNQTIIQNYLSNAKHYTEMKYD